MSIKDLFVKKCINKSPAIASTGDKPFRYRRSDLTEWAKEAFERGEKYIYTEPVNPDDPCGKLRLCEPKYEYVLNLTLSEEEFNKIDEFMISLINSKNK